jgi:hypothetical protein
MNDIEFDVEVLNRRLKKTPHCYYPAFNEEKHCVSNTYYYQYNDENGLWLISDSDYNEKLPIEISMDFNGRFTSMTIYQDMGNELRMINAMHVEKSDTNLIDTIIDNFCKEYAGHKKKDILIWGDPSGFNHTPQSNLSIFEQIRVKFIQNGWNPEIMAKASYDNHKLRHLVIDSILSESNDRLPHIRINQNKCKNVIISIQKTPMNQDFSKNKSSEKNLANQALATHYSDTFDYIVYPKYVHLFNEQTSGLEISFMSW